MVKVPKDCVVSTLWHLKTQRLKPVRLIISLCFDWFYIFGIMFAMLSLLFPVLFLNLCVPLHLLPYFDDDELRLHYLHLWLVKLEDLFSVFLCSVSVCL